MSKVEKLFRWGTILVGEGFTLITIGMLFTSRQYNRLPLAFATLLMLFIPLMLERLFSCRIQLPIYIFGLFYVMGPMLGQCHNLYYLVSWWDKLLHISGGILFALFGIFLFSWLGGNEKKHFLVGVFALFFSMAVSMIWEFAEFGADQFLGMDMQDDMIITHIHSYLLNDKVGETGSIENIEEVFVNGQPLPFEGYLDIGLIDTMLDMMLETLGALAAAAGHWIDRGRHRAFIPKAEVI